MLRRPLEGITFGFTDYEDRPPFDPNILQLHAEIVANDAEICAYVRQLGGTVLETEECTDYRINPVGSDTRAQTRRVLANIAGLPRIAEQSFEDADRITIEQLKQDISAGNPRLFAYQERDRGHAKYLIETSEQVEKIEQLGKEYTAQTGKQLYTNFVVRPFVQTPGRSFTSYRVTATAAGNVQAAGLVYSGHTKDTPRKIIKDCQDNGDEYLAFMTRHFEDPESPFFLNAQDVRSNVICGGSMIPLMGKNRPLLKEGEAEILEQHGIDPQKPEVPAELLEHTQTIGRLAAPKIDLLVGADYIQQQDGRRYLLEVNSTPASMDYNLCHLGGKADPNSAMHLARLEAIKHIASRTK
jgi:hypothetical protein